MRRPARRHHHELIFKLLRLRRPPQAGVPKDKNLVEHARGDWTVGKWCVDVPRIRFEQGL